MRIVTFFIRWVITLGVLGALVYFLCGQLWMGVSLQGFLDQMKSVEISKQKVAEYTRICQKAPSSSGSSTALAMQLRFIDNQNYNIELRCTLLEGTPVVMSTGKLPFLVSKEPGSSGFYVDLYGPSISTIELRSLYATKKLSIDTTSQYQGMGTADAVSPATTCGGWGYQCCDSIAQKGTGLGQLEGVTDCSNNCFAACTARPYIQSFTSDPYPMSGNVIRMDSSELTVTFSYMATLVGGKITSTHLDFGDGQFQDSTEPISAVVHTYTCASKCDFTATLTAKDAAGNSSVVNESSTLYIKRE